MDLKAGQQVWINGNWQIAGKRSFLGMVMGDKNGEIIIDDFGDKEYIVILGPGLPSIASEYDAAHFYHQDEIYPPLLSKQFRCYYAERHEITLAPIRDHIQI